MQKLKLDKGQFIIFLLSLLPIIFWIFTPKLDLFFSNLQTGLVGFGEIFGLVGMVLFSLNIILATRLPIIEKLFGGLSNIYKKHDFLGQLAFVLLLFHPLLLLPRYASNIKGVFSFLFFSDLWARNFGIFALWIMLLLIVLTLYLRPKYNIWKITHKFFGAALFFGALHVYFIPGYVMNNLLLKGYVLFIAVLAILAFLYKSVFGRFFVKKYTYFVKKIKKLDDDIIEITLKPENKHLMFRPGQFIFISFKQKGLSSESHPFSITSSPKEELLKISVKKLGDYTTELYSRLKEGSAAEIEGPFGSFSYLNTENKNQVWIAGGIGITPFLSSIKDLRDKNNYSINLFYCVKNKREAIYLNLLEEESKKNPQINIIPVYSEKKGHISIEYLQNHLKNFVSNDFFICTPPSMIKKLKIDLINSGINKRKIYSEEFNF